MADPPRNRTAAALLPLKPAVFDILMVLLEGEAHGYRIKQQIQHRTHGTRRFDPGTLYRWVGRMLDDGLIEESDQRPDPERDDARRRYYRLTPFGRAVAAAEAERMAELVDRARSRRLIKPRTV